MYYIRLIIWYITYPFREVIYNPLRVLKGPKKLLNLSLPVRVALLVSLFLIILTTVMYLVFLFDLTKERAGWEMWWTWPRATAIIVLNIAIPVVVWQAMKLWLEGEESQFPDIDFAWKAGISAMKEQGIDPTEVPIFLVLGNRDSDQVHNLFEASGLPLRVHDTPEGPAALHWFATPDAVYLACTESSWLSRVASLGAQGAAAAPVAAAPAASFSGGNDIRGTIVAGGGSFVAAEKPDIRATMGPDSGPAPSSGPSPGGQRNAAIYGTMVAGAGAMDSSGAPSPAMNVSSAVSVAESNEQRARLSYVCHLLMRLRQPVCPLNGILTVLPFDCIQRSAAEGQAVQRATKGDLTTVFETTKLRCSVVALVAGMEGESGFRELVRRVGPDRAKSNRFGKGFNLWNPPTPEQIEAVSRHACGAFEDWTYTLFRERDGLRKHGNTKLYSLLCKIRCHLTDRLSNILVDAYSIENEKEGSREALLFSGVYFTACGETDDRQAFVKAVFDKLMQEENELDWTEEALIEDDRYQNLANLVMLFNGAMILSLIGMFIWYYFKLKSEI